MAKQTGPIRITGTFNGICYYIAEGVYLARKSYVHSKKRIAYDPAFQSVRDNNSEFKGAVKVAKVVQDVLSIVLSALGKPRFIGKLTGLVKRIINLETGIRGKRPILFTKHKAMLEGFEFNPNVSFMKTFKAKITAKCADNGRDFYILLEDLVPQNLGVAPSGATHFRMVQVAFILSDYTFNTDIEAYTPLSSSLNGVNDLIYSDFTPLVNKDSFHFLDQVKLPEFSSDQPQVSILHCLGIEFFKQHESKYLPLRHGNCMSIIKVW